MGRAWCVNILEAKPPYIGVYEPKMTFSCWNIILFENFRHFFSHFFTFLIFNGRYILLANFSTCPTMFFGLSNDLSNILKWCRIAVYDGKI